MASQPRREWVKDRTVNLRDGAEELWDCNPDIYNSFGPWSALKLIIHSATVNMYTKVISDHKQDFFYIDALAGSGISVYGEEEDCFLGSPILAAKEATEPFTKMYFIENDSDKASALRDRLDYAFNESSIETSEPEDYMVLEGDVHKKLDDVIDDIWNTAYESPGKPNFNHLTFIDNQGLTFKWEGIKKIAPKPTGDLLINFPSSDIIRTAHHDPSKETMDDFYGGNMWQEEEMSKSQLKDVYCGRLRGVEKEKQVIANVESGTKSYEYDMIYATRETTKGSGYIDAVDYVREFIEAVDGADVDDMLKVIRGDRTTMEQYLPETENGDNQSSLDEFL